MSNINTLILKKEVNNMTIGASIKVPDLYQKIIKETEELGFQQSCDVKTGVLLQTLVASKPGGKFLELGTGAGASTAWIVSGMDSASSLLTVELDDALQSIAKRYLGDDERIIFFHEDGADFISNLYKTDLPFRHVA
jgi:predicted O-methyltransferase YrrM